MELIKLAKQLDFSSENEYFDYCIDSWFNGNFSQCNKLFKALTKTQRKQLINYIRDCYDYRHQVETFYFNLL